MTTANTPDPVHNKIVPLAPDRAAAQKTLERILALDLQACSLDVCLASEQDGSDVPLVRRAQLTEKAAHEFRDALKRALAPAKKALDEQDLLLRAFEPDSSLQEGEIEYLQIADFTSLPPQLAPLKKFVDLENLRANEEAFVNGLRFYTVIVQPPPAAGFQEPIYYYRWYSHTFRLHDSPHHLIFWRSQQENYDIIEDQAFLFDRHVDCLSYGGQMFVLQKYYFYTIFRLEEELKKIAEKALDELEVMGFIQNFQQFKHDCLRNKNKYRILSKIYSKPYFRSLTIEKLEQTIDDYQMPIQVQLVGQRREKRMLYNSSQPWAILHLLDDQYVSSSMTDLDYQARGKNEVRPRANRPVRHISPKQRNARP
jgi:hypothetical protein